MERITNTHVFFWGSEFSNWYECEFTYLDEKFYNSEQAFMSRKAAYFEDWETFDKIIKSGQDPSVAKKLGREVKNFDSKLWMDVCFDEMVDVNIAKYSQNPELKEILLSTGNKTLVEASPYDKIWGIGLHYKDNDCLDESKWKGMNLLGKALMEVRKQLK
jgi:ribA/ribD-fused uncharacterized protein